MNWDVVFWVWFVITLIFSVIIFIANRLTPGYLFVLQLLIIVGLGLVKLTGRASLEAIRDTTKTIYDFWLRASKIEKKPKVKRKILEELT